jgi:phage-related protein
MPCVSLELNPGFNNALGSLQNASNVLMALSSDSCNILGAIPGLGAIEKGIQDVFAAVAGITSAINNAISRILGSINNIIDTAVGAVQNIIGNLLTTFNSIVDTVGGFVSQISGMIDSFINVVAAQANLSGILSCVGVIGKLTGMPEGVSSQIDDLAAKLASGSAVSDIVSEGIADIKNAAASAATDALNGINDKINGTITNALGNINLGIASLKAFECQEV